jgi:hypothetical protein
MKNTQILKMKIQHFEQGVLDNIKSRMGCLSVVTCVWLCSYMNVVGMKAREKPLLMLEYLTRVKTEQQTTSTERLDIFCCIAYVK